MITRVASSRYRVLALRYRIVTSVTFVKSRFLTALPESRGDRTEEQTSVVPYHYAG
jgi:hypothetical protein